LERASGLSGQKFSGDGGAEGGGGAAGQVAPMTRKGEASKA